MPLLGTSGAVVLGSLLLIIANLCFGAAIVFYNSFLPQIASPDRRDDVSSRGWALGYLGGGLYVTATVELITITNGLVTDNQAPFGRGGGFFFSGMNVYVGR